MDTKMIEVSRNPLVLILKLPSEYNKGILDAAKALAECTEEIGYKYPGYKFQLLPLSYGTNQILDSVIAITT